MKNVKFILFIVSSLILSVSVTASGVAYKAKSGAVATSSKKFDVQDFAISNDVNGDFINEKTIVQSIKTKPDDPDPNFNFNYLELKPTKLAVIQNQNFDRVTS